MSDSQQIALARAERDEAERLSEQAERRLGRLRLAGAPPGEIERASQLVVYASRLAARARRRANRARRAYAPQASARRPR